MRRHPNYYTVVLVLRCVSMHHGKVSQEFKRARVTSQISGQCQGQCTRTSFYSDALDAGLCALYRIKALRWTECVPARSTSSKEAIRIGTIILVVSPGMEGLLPNDRLIKRLNSQIHRSGRRLQKSGRGLRWPSRSRGADVQGGERRRG
jgi:hypothetical protein